MFKRRAILLTLLSAGPALAQPVIIPLQSQPDADKSQGPVASAPPVAPPTAAPSQPETGIARGNDTNQQEEAFQPPDKPKPQ